MADHPLYDEITMHKRGNVWQYRWFIKTELSSAGKGTDNRKSTGKKDFKEACKIAAIAYEEFLQTIGKGERVSLSGQVTVDDCFHRATESYRVRIGMGHNTKSHWNTIEKNYLLEIQPFFGTTPVTDVNSKMWKDYLADLYKRKPDISKNYVRLIKGSLRTCLNVADELVEDYRLPTLKDGLKFNNNNAKRIWFSIREQHKLLTALDDNIQGKTRKTDLYSAESLRDRVHLMLYTGLRPEELGIIRCKDVRLKGVRENGKVYQVTVINVPDEDGAKTKSRVTVGVKGSGTVYKRILTRRGLDRNSNEKLFDQNNRSRFVQILEEQDIRGEKKGEYRTFESLRHSFISNRFLEGVNVNEIAKNCGNSPKMIEDHYTNHITPLDFEEYQKFNDRLRKKEQAESGGDPDEPPKPKLKPVPYEYDSGEQLQRGKQLAKLLHELEELEMDDEASTLTENFSDRDKDALNYFYAVQEEKEDKKTG